MMLLSRSIIWLLLTLVVFAFSATITAAPAAQSACTRIAPPEPGAYNETLTHDGALRRYIVYIPEGYTGAEAVPLVFSLHGFASNAPQHRLYAGWDAVADANNFIVVYPYGTDVPLRWNSGFGGFFGGADDIGFFRAMVDTLRGRLCIDETRIYADGMSNGGGMVYRLACEAADVFAAFGAVAGAYDPNPIFCTPARPVPVIAYHGTEDTIVPYEGNAPFLPNIESWVQAWAERNECNETPDVLTVSDEVTATAYNGCAENADVVLYTIESGGHTWPGGDFGGLTDIPLIGVVNTDIDATALTWAFFEVHPQIGS